MNTSTGCLITLLLTAGAAAQQFSDNTADIPAGSPVNDSRTDQVDFADIDLDGDWDAAFAEGGEQGAQQNRLWLNLGGEQGGTVGVFVDQTTTRFPQVLDNSRDVEFADYDGDGDPDLFVANHSAITDQPSRFWTNLGPSSQAGFYVDETDQRWVGLGGAGSSIFPGLVLPGGGWIDHPGDGDFADLDNDGDLDLVQGSYGKGYNAQIPTRIFLNDGAGYFSEFNPSGFQLPQTSIADGDPGLWCEGVQFADTTDVTGANCDIALGVADLEIGDTDGDLDLDLLLGDKFGDPRFFANRLEETGGLAFRDVTHAVFPPNWAPSGGHYDQELGDMDEDGDLDLYGLNWIGATFGDVVLENQGGTFGTPVAVPGTNTDAEDADFIDYDSDGDLDVYVANFSGQDLMVRNDGNLTYTLTTTVLPPGLDGVGRDGEVADVDLDGDPDVFIANSKGFGIADLRNYYLENSGTPDVHAPRVPLLESAAGGPATSAPTVVRAQVYDNAPYYAVWYYDVALEVTVDGGPAFEVPMASSGGQIFRGELSGQLVGTVQYRVLARDARGNEGGSATESYVATPGACDSQIQTYCTGKQNSLGCTPVIALDSCVSLTDATPSYVLGGDFQNFKNGLFFYGYGPAALPFQGGTLCVQPPLRRTGVQSSGGTLPPVNDCSGVYSFDLNAWVQSGLDPLLGAGATLWGQWWGRDPASTFGVSLSDAVEATVAP